MSDGEWVVTVIGAEPVVMWGEDAEGCPRWSVAAPGWKFESVTNPGQFLELGSGSLIAATPCSPEDCDVENSSLLIAGHSVAELREIALMDRFRR